MFFSTMFLNINPILGTFSGVYADILTNMPRTLKYSLYLFLIIVYVLHLVIQYWHQVRLIEDRIVIIGAKTEILDWLSSVCNGLLVPIMVLAFVFFSVIHELHPIIYITMILYCTILAFLTWRSYKTRYEAKVKDVKDMKQRVFFKEDLTIEINGNEFDIDCAFRRKKFINEVRKRKADSIQGQVK